MAAWSWEGGWLATADSTFTSGFGTQPFGTSPFGTGTVEGEEPEEPGPVTDPIQLAQSTPEYKARQWALQTQNVVWPSQRRAASTAAPHRRWS